jgi:predicted short-subunit dehydrogenase-like oxidoreductase (DUF2520 family)
MSVPSRRRSKAPTEPTHHEPTLARPTTVGIVGAGRVGSTLGAALRRAGYRLVGASGASAASVARIREVLVGVETGTPEAVAQAADVVLLTVPDDALAGLVERLVAAGAIRAGQIVVHTSGAHGVSVLAPATVVGALPMALHPAMTFTGTAGDLDRLAQHVSWGVTVPDPLRAAAARIVTDLGGCVEWVAEENRALYHAALVHGANHLVTLVNESMDRLRDAGVHHPEQVLEPLLRAALDNTLRSGDAALTGPVSRGDAGTIGRHLVTLNSRAPDSVPVYLALARRTADRAIASGRLPAKDAEPLLGVLAEQPRTEARSEPAVANQRSHQ